MPEASCMRYTLMKFPIQPTGAQGSENPKERPFPTIHFTLPKGKKKHQHL